MNKSKKALVTIILTIVILISSILTVYFVSVKSLMPAKENVIVVQNPGDSNAKEILLDENDSKKIIQLIKSAEKIPANYSIDFSVPACMFDDELYLKVGNKMYYLSCDDCDTVLCNSRYFYIKHSVKSQIYDIMYKATKFH